ncbi:MAG: hypothetical protein PF961_16365 [Planctomycetota bacterium]|nr:hypothetical protein [Planctomycetota bacterium]
MPLICRLTAALCLSLVAGGLRAESKVFSEIQGVVAMEAENATTGTDWKPRNDKLGGVASSGGWSLEDAGGALRYDITFTHPGRYYVWFRMAKPMSGYPPDKANDCFVRFNGTSAHTTNGTTVWTVDGMGTHNKSLTWQSRPKSHDSAARAWHVYIEVEKAGQHRFEVLSRSPGFLVDKIVLIHEQKGGDAEGGGATADRIPAILKGFGPEETGKSG